MSGLRSRYSGSVKANSSLVVTTSDSDSRIKKHADYVCNNTDDQVEIQAAIDKFADAGNYGDVYLTGDFYISAPIRMRNKVALSAVSANHGARLTIVAGSDCNGIEIAHKEGSGQAAITGIYIEGNKDNNAAGSGFVMPTNGLRVTNSGAGCANSTVQVTSTQIIFKRDTVADYTITLSDDTGTLISEIINVVNGNNGWTVTNITGGLPGAVKTAHCTTTPSNALAVVAATDTYTVNADLALGITYDYFFHQCMCLHPNDYCWWTPAGHSIHWERCVAEYAGVDGFNIVGGIDGVRMYGCFGADNIGNGYVIDATNPILTGCRATSNTGHGFSMPVNAALLSGCESANNVEANKAGFHIAGDAVVINGCRSIGDEVGIKMEGSYCAISGTSVINADTYGIHVSGSGTHNSIAGNNILSSGSQGILMAGSLNTISGNHVTDSGTTDDCYDSSYNNVWIGNSNECRFASRSGATTLTATGSGSKAAYRSYNASSQVTFQLPAAILGLEYSFVVGKDTQECRIEPSGTETIAIGGVQQVAGKYITANALNETITLKCIVTGEWEDYYKAGTWTAEA